MIRVVNVTKHFGSRAVLDGVNLELAPGHVAVLTGPSGEGKSTLMRCMNGLESFESGTIHAFGVDLVPRARGERETAAVRAATRAVRGKVGFVFQSFALFPHMTALANVMEAPVHVQGLTANEARDSAVSLLERVGLAARRNAYPRELSGGEAQRVAIARALAVKPKALLMDEPTSALDPERKASLVELLGSLASAGTTLVIVSHEAAVLRSIATRVLVLAKGHLTDAPH